MRKARVHHQSYESYDIDMRNLNEMNYENSRRLSGMFLEEQDF